jgi:Flp pilus assembly pilin Flp
VRAALHIAVPRFRIIRESRGQDLIEYALLLGLLATAGGAILPEIGDSIQEVFAEARYALYRAGGSAYHHQ